MFDRMLHAYEAKWSLSSSPAAIVMAYLDWWLHLINAPGQRAILAATLSLQWTKLAHATERWLAGDFRPIVEPRTDDHRFHDPEWQRPPFSMIYQSFLLAEQWWQEATTSVRGVSEGNENIVAFMTRQLLDVFAPSNFLVTNPKVLDRTIASGGANLLVGACNLTEDYQRIIEKRKPVGAEQFPVGSRVATTPGKVVLRNNLMELLHFAPKTEQVHAEPILIVPAWIMKYYILDLSPENSLVRYLVAAGHTVFVISWRNPHSEDRDLGMSDYLLDGPMAALDAISAICPNRKVHACGYCLGGTLLAIAAAALARDGQDRLETLTLLAAQVDFSEAGELMLFINESQIAYLEDSMWASGFLDTRQMAGAFQLLRSNDLIWSRWIKEYLMGERTPMTDLMAWNADLTRMPYRMHSEYLRHLFLNNALAGGQYLVDGRPVALPDIRVPIFAVSTERDHVSPWRSVYKICLLTHTDVSFVLASGGHNAGIVSEPGHPHRSFQIARHQADDAYLAPERWRKIARQFSGSWWPSWQDWLARHSSTMIAPPPLGAPSHGFPALADAPGYYVLEE